MYLMMKLRCMAENVSIYYKIQIPYLTARKREQKQQPPKPWPKLTQWLQNKTEMEQKIAGYWFHRIE